MNINNLKVTILLATHNRAHLIGETLDSILAQTFKNWKCLVVDDFSIDNTQAIVQKFTEKDTRFFYFQKPEKINKGLSASRNYGLELANSHAPDFIQFFDDDDLMHPKKLEIQIKNLLDNPKAQFSLCGALNFIGKNEIDWQEKKVFYISDKYSLGEAYLTGKIRFVAQVPLFKYSYAKNLHFDEDLFYAEEWTLFSMCFLLNEPDYVKVDEILFYRRKHANSITEGKDENFQKRKTSAVTGVKILDFLNENNCHSRITLLYFIREFLIYKFDSHILDLLEKKLRVHPHISRLDIFKYRSTRYIHLLSRKIILRLLNF